MLELAPELGNLRDSVESTARGFPSFEGAQVTVGEAAVWVLEPSNGQVSRIDPDTGQVSGSPEVDARSIAVGQGSIWLGGNIGVTRMDPATGEFLKVIDVGGPPSAWTSIAVGGAAVWFARASAPKLWQIETRTNAITQTFAVGAGPASVAVGEGGVWVANSIDGTVSRIGSNEATIPLGAPTRGVVAAYGGVWTSPGDPVR